jgi:hypothetical protein
MMRRWYAAQRSSVCALFTKREIAKKEFRWRDRTSSFKPHRGWASAKDISIAECLTPGRVDSESTIGATQTTNVVIFSAGNHFASTDTTRTHRDTRRKKCFAIYTILRLDSVGITVSATQAVPCLQGLKDISTVRKQSSCNRQFMEANGFNKKETNYPKE